MQHICGFYTAFERVLWVMLSRFKGLLLLTMFAIILQAPGLEVMQKMSAAEMREALAKKKKPDPRKEKLSAKAKLDMFQRL